MFLSTKNINKIYQNGSVNFQALYDINISLKKGSIGALVGASGSGKTTLLNIIGALDKTTSGEVSVDGANLSTKTLAELSQFRRDYLGFIFQSYNLIPVLTAFENISLSLFQGSSEQKSKSNGNTSSCGIRGERTFLPKSALWRTTTTCIDSKSSCQNPSTNSRG
ncbi:MAG: ABC transporter ATP-binding protein [Brevinema sp.]